MRSVSLQGYFTQVSPAEARHAISVVKTVTGDSVRRKVVDATKCANCHEWFEGHGGNRVIGRETGNAELVCVLCHVPGLATSGRRIPDTTLRLPRTVGRDADLCVDRCRKAEILTEWGLMNRPNVHQDDQHRARPAGWSPTTSRK